VRFSDVANLLGVQPFAHYCRLVASDKYWIDEDMKTMMHPQVMLVWMMNDQPLSAQHGAPIRLVIPFRYGARSIKAVTDISFGAPGLADAEVERIARLAQAHEFVERLPDGYDTVIGERGITLSGGQRQRLAIARALAVDPRILILDDATASVDASTEARIRLGLRQAMRNRTTLIIAHRLSTIALADEIVVLDDGRIAARGTHDELLETSPVYRDIYEHGLLERQFADAVEARAETDALEAAS